MGLFSFVLKFAKITGPIMGNRPIRKTKLLKTKGDTIMKKIRIYKDMTKTKIRLITYIMIKQHYEAKIEKEVAYLKTLRQDWKND